MSGVPGAAAERELLFSWQEGMALELIGAAMGVGRMPPLDQYERLLQIRPELLRVAADRIARRCLSELWHQGGWRRRTVLRGGRRVEGRLSDAALNEGFELAFTAASHSLVEVLIRQLPELALQSRNQPGEARQRAGKRAIKDMIPIRDTAPGDWLFFALVDANLRRHGLPTDLVDNLSKRLCHGSPLAGLAALWTIDPSQSRIELLVSPRAVRLVECLEGPIIARWRTALSDAMRPEPLDRFVQRWEWIGRGLKLWLRALEGAGRLDLSGPLFAAAEVLVAQTGSDPRTTVITNCRAGSMQEGERALQAVAGAFDLGDALHDSWARMRTQRYGDARYEESQLFLRGEDLVVQIEALRIVARQLRGRLG